MSLYKLADYESKIFYQHDAKFKIIPKLNQEMIKEFKNFIMKIKNRNDTTNSEDNNHYFWTIDKDANNIIVDEKTDMVDNDIFDQFVTLACWLFKRRYRIDGSFYYRIRNMMEHILANEQNTFVTHHILFDEIEISSYFDDEQTIDIGRKIILDTKKKINTIVAQYNSQPSDSSSFSGENRHFSKTIFRKTVANDTTISKTVHEKTFSTEDSIQESKDLFDIFQKRLDKIENQIKSNDYLYKIFPMASIVVTVGSLIYLFLRKSNIGFIDCKITLP